MISWLQKISPCLRHNSDTTPTIDYAKLSHLHALQRLSSTDSAQLHSALPSSNKFLRLLRSAAIHLKMSAQAPQAVLGLSSPPIPGQVCLLPKDPAQDDHYKGEDCPKRIFGRLAVVLSRPNDIGVVEFSVVSVLPSPCLSLIHIIGN